MYVIIAFNFNQQKGNKMKKFTVFLCAMLLILLFTVQLHAYSVTVNYDTGTTQVTDALTGYSTTGAMMDGMSVTAFFADGSYETLLWADTGATSGGVSGSDWSLGEVGDTFGGTWTLNADVTLAGIYLDAGTGDSVFDISFAGFGTDGSANGLTFAVQDCDDPDADITATYIDQVALSGSVPVGDLWRYLSIDFTDGFNGELTFIADTDNLEFAGDINPVPEPATLILFGTGLLGLAGLGRKKFFKK